MMQPETGIQITKIAPDTIFVQGGPPMEGYRIDFRSPSGITSYVKVPRSDDMEQLVRQEVQLEADRLEAALRSHGTPGVTSFPRHRGST